MLCCTKQLKTLKIGYSIQNSAETTALARGLKSRCTLENLDLASSKFAPKVMGASGMKALAGALKENYSLKFLSLASCINTIAEAQVCKQCPLPGL